MKEMTQDEKLINLEKYITFTRSLWIFKHEEEHAIYGVTSEIGEIMTAFKRVAGPGKALNKANLNQECGDCFFFLCQIVYMNKLDNVCLIPVRISESGLNPRKITFAMMKEAVRINDLLLNNDHSSYLTGSINAIVNYLNLLVKSIGITMEQCMNTNFMHLTRANEKRVRQMERNEAEEMAYLEDLTNDFIEYNKQ
jgi:NTP pyrophosphatase (non-canonical NTP hydrolase)